MRCELLKDVALRTQKPPQLADRVLEVVDAGERFPARLLRDLVLQRVDDVVELVENRKRRVDNGVDREVGEKGRLAVRELGALLDAFLELFELGRRLQVDGDQVVRADEE